MCISMYAFVALVALPMHLQRSTSAYHFDGQAQQMEEEHNVIPHHKQYLFIQAPAHTARVSSLGIVCVCSCFFITTASVIMTGLLATAEQNEVKSVEQSK